jgi:hypothetical protein
MPKAVVIYVLRFRWRDSRRTRMRVFKDRRLQAIFAIKPPRSTPRALILKPISASLGNQRDQSQLWLWALEEDADQGQRLSHFLRQPVRVDSQMQRTIHHEDAETVFSRVQGQCGASSREAQPSPKQYRRLNLGGADRSALTTDPVDAEPGRLAFCLTGPLSLHSRRLDRRRDRRAFHLPRSERTGARVCLI